MQSFRIIFGCVSRVTESFISNDHCALQYLLNMATIYGDDTDSSNTVATQDTQDTQDTGTNEETENLKKYRNYWWKTGNFHPRAKWEEVR